MDSGQRSRSSSRERKGGGEKIGEWKENRHKEVRGAEQNAVQGVKTVNLTDIYHPYRLYRLSGSRVEVEICFVQSYVIHNLIQPLLLPSFSLHPDPGGGYYSLSNLTQPFERRSETGAASHPTFYLPVVAGSP